MNMPEPPAFPVTADRELSATGARRKSTAQERGAALAALLGVQETVQRAADAFAAGLDDPNLYREVADILQAAVYVVRSATGAAWHPGYGISGQPDDGATPHPARTLEQILIHHGADVRTHDDWQDQIPTWSADRGSCGCPPCYLATVG